MEQLKLAWVYRFWIAVGIVALMPIVSYFVDTRTLADKAEAQATDLKTKKGLLEKGAQGANPNDEWASAVNALRDTLSSKVDVAWVDLYKKQVDFMTWPKEVEAEYVAAGDKGAATVVDQNTKLTYQVVYASQYKDLFKIVDPVDQKGKGLVQLDPKILEPYIKPWSQEGQNPPTVPEAWLAQEDIWLLRALLSVVARANQGSTRVQESTVKRIAEIHIGGLTAVDDQSKAKKEQLSPRGDAQAGPSGGATGREIKGTLYRQIPVYMKLIVDQPRLLEVLAEFSNSDIPMQVRQVSFTEIPINVRHDARLMALLGETAKKSDVTQKLGSAPAKDDEFFQMAELDVWARAIFYNKPPQVEKEEAAAKAEADKVKAEQTKAPPATPGGANQ